MGDGWAATLAAGFSVFLLVGFNSVGTGKAAAVILGTAGALGGAVAIAGAVGLDGAVAIAGAASGGGTSIAIALPGGGLVTDG